LYKWKVSKEKGMQGDLSDVGRSSAEMLRSEEPQADPPKRELKAKSSKEATLPGEDPLDEFLDTVKS